MVENADYGLRIVDSGSGLGLRTRIADSECGLGLRTWNADSDCALGLRTQTRTRTVDYELGLRIRIADYGLRARTADYGLRKNESTACTTLF